MIARRGKPFAGIRIGIVTLETAHDLAPGNVQHAASFPFPVLYRPVRGVDFALIARGDPTAREPILEAVRDLATMGAEIIAGACGSFGHYQREAAAAVDVPVCLSSLVQVPFLLAVLPARQRLGVIFARAATFTSLVKAACGITEAQERRLLVLEADRLPAFAPVMNDQERLNSPALEAELCALATAAQVAHPDIGGWLLQCSDLPPYARALARATGRPVWDMSVLIRHLHDAALPPDYTACA